jgi:hypothetical protein
VKLLVARTALVTLCLVGTSAYPLASCAAGIVGDTGDSGSGGPSDDSATPPREAGSPADDVAAPVGNDSSPGDASTSTDATGNAPDVQGDTSPGADDATGSGGPDAADAAHDAASAPDAAIPTDGLVGQWLCSGNTSDTSDAGNDGVNVSVTFGADRHGTASSACSFDGTASNIAVPSAASLNVTTTWSLSAWVQPSSFSVLAGIVSKYHAVNSDGPTVRLSYNTPYTGIDVNEATNVADAATGLLTAGSWTHVGVTVNGVAVLCYVNGALAYAGTAGYATSSNNDSFDIGLDYTNRFFAGSIDDVRLYDRVLSAAEIETLYLAP